MFYRPALRFPALMVLLTLSFLCVVAAFTARSSAAKLGIGSPTVTLQQPNTVAPNSVRRLSLPAKDLVFDSNTQAIYASVPGTAGVNGNSLTRIDPAAGTIGASVFIGSDPNKLAISDNKQFIYAGLDGEGAVRRFDIATQTAQLRFSLGNYEQNGALLVEDIEVLPGAPQSVAISRRVLRRSPDHAAVAIYDDGVQRPTTTNVNFGTANRIEFSSTAATIYGFNSQDTGLQTYRLSVTALGVSIAGQLPVSFQEFGNIEFEGGRLYHTAGKVSDPEAGTILGTYAGMNFFPFNNAPSVVVDTPNNRVYFLAGGAADPGSSGQARVYAFDKTTFALVASYTITSVTGKVGSLVQWGPNGLAFRDDNAVYLIPTPVPGPPPSLPTPTPVPTPTATPLPGELRQIALATKDLVVEPNAQNIYASVPGSAGALGNRLALVDPVSGTIASSVPIGSEPNKLAVSDNGQFIYVGLDGDNAVRRFDVATQTAGPQFSTVAGPRDISAMPGNPNSIAVLRRASADEVLIYDNGVPRTITKLHDVSRIAFSNSPEVLYGVQTESSSYNFSKMTVASCGVALAKGAEGLFPTEDIKYDNGRAYSTRGFVIDPEIPSLVGTFFVTDIGFSFLVEPDSKANRIYSLTATGSSATLKVFDLQTFVLLGTLNLPGVTDFPTSLLRWGANGLVFNTPTQVFLLQNALIGGSLPVTPAPPALPSTFTVTGNVMSNANLQPTSGVTITFSGSQSGTTQTDAQGNFSIPNVPLCGPLTVTPTKTNWVFTPASIVITDPSVQRANFASFHKVVGFVQSSVTVSEGTTKVFLAIGRSTGGPLPPATTDIPYSTSSGTASDRSDFTPAFGTFHFDVGTSQAPLEVLITNDVFVEGLETFTATLEPVPGFDMVNQTVTVMIVDNDTTPPVTSPLQNALFFVRR
ncbi:MAG TPA: Calx-beta domain-containing protein, partial [Pyrinomonadaceae bacterium]